MSHDPEKLFAERLNRLLGLGFEQEIAIDALTLLEGATFEALVAFIIKKHGVRSMDAERAKRARLQTLGPLQAFSPEIGSIPRFDPPDAPLVQEQTQSSLDSSSDDRTRSPSPPPIPPLPVWLQGNRQSPPPLPPPPLIEDAPPVPPPPTRESPVHSVRITPLDAILRRSTPPPAPPDYKLTPKATVSYTSPTGNTRNGAISTLPPPVFGTPPLVQRSQSRPLSSVVQTSPALLVSMQRSATVDSKPPSSSPIPQRNLFDFLWKSKHERQLTTLVFEEYPLYSRLSPIDPATVSTETMEKSRKLRFTVERYVARLFKEQGEREMRRSDLESEMRKLHLTDKQKVNLRVVLAQKESEYLRSKRAAIDKSQFAIIKVIGRGAFGEVMLVRRKETQQLYAMKALLKSEIVKKNQIAHVKVERDILSAADNEWLVRLYYSFQDKECLYFVMEYVPGGDLMNLLIKLGRFSEEMSRFYIGELVMVVESVHQMGFIHRDVKPDNILIDAEGHIKLTDFGLCTGLRREDDESLINFGSEQQHSLGPSRGEAHDRRVGVRSLVGTPNYIAPEVFQRSVYGKECDWWSVGVILFEMIVGYPPFSATTPRDTRHKVINWRQYLSFPSFINPIARDLIKKLCCDAPNRLGTVGGAEEIKSHPFFKNFSWTRSGTVPFKPRITHETDTSNFASDLTRLPEGRREAKESTPLHDSDEEFADFNWARFWDGGRTNSTSSASSSASYGK